MLFKKELLDKLDQLRSKYPNFNIHVLLLMLQDITRLYRYPPHELAINNEYYIKYIDDVILLENHPAMQGYMESVYKIMLCFNYIYSTLAINKQLLPLLFLAIEQRMDTTDEERCAEKTLLSMLIEKPFEVLKLIARNSERLTFVNMQPQLKQRMHQLVTKEATKIGLNLSVGEIASTLLDRGNIIANAGKALEELPTLMKRFSRKACQISIGLYLLDNIKKPLSQPWILDCSFLKASVKLGFREKDKKKVADYIATRQNENDFLSCLRKYPKAVKLSSAVKFFQALNNKPVQYTKAEHDALKNDEGSRLTTLHNLIMANNK